jgi:serine kinase of HPr protein (carbohydrate metabolism regulator)
VATLKDFPGIIICNNRPVPEDLLEAAIKERVGLFVTEKNQYKVSGLLFELLNG